MEPEEAVSAMEAIIRAEQDRGIRMALDVAARMLVAGGQAAWGDEIICLKPERVRRMTKVEG